MRSSAATASSASSLDVSSAFVASTVEKNGAHKRAAPISSSTTLQLDEAKAGAAEGLGDDERLEAELVGHLAPDRLVVALGGRHEPSHLGLR